MSLVLLRSEDLRYGRLRAAVKAPDELAALGLDYAPRRPRLLAIRAKEDYKRSFATTEDDISNQPQPLCQTQGHARPAMEQ